MFLSRVISSGHKSDKNFLVTLSAADMYQEKEETRGDQIQYSNEHSYECNCSDFIMARRKEGDTHVQ